jgi:hypothetical protein
MRLIVRLASVPVNRLIAVSPWADMGEANSGDPEAGS